LCDNLVVYTTTTFLQEIFARHVNDLSEEDLERHAQELILEIFQESERGLEDGFPSILNARNIKGKAKLTTIK